MRITKSEISMRIWCSSMSVTSQGAFVDIPEISHSDVCSRSGAHPRAFDSLLALQNVYLHTKSRKKPCLRVFSPIYFLLLYLPRAHLSNCLSRAKLKRWNSKAFNSIHDRPHSILSFSFLRFSIIWNFLHAAASKMSIWYVFIHFKVVSGCFTV